MEAVGEITEKIVAIFKKAPIKNYNKTEYLSWAIGRIVRKILNLPLNYKLIILAFIIFLYYQFSSENFPSYYVTRVVDGDTIVIQDGSNQRKVRLAGIDSPETKHPSKPKQCYGQEASDALTSLLTGEYVKVDFQGKDKYNRDIAYVYYRDRCVNEVMISSGLAFHYAKYGHKYENKYEKLEQKARQKNEGLWGACNAYDY
mgnify:CR=1 FL=1